MADYLDWKPQDIRRALRRRISQDVGIIQGSDYKPLLKQIRDKFLSENGRKWKPFEFHSFNKLHAVLNISERNVFTVNIASTEYLKSLEEGRGPSFRGGDSSWMDATNPSSRLRRWIKARKLTLDEKYASSNWRSREDGSRKHFRRSKAKTKEQQERSLAFIIGRKIRKHGTERYHKPVNLYSSTIDRWLLKEQDRLFDLLWAYAQNMANGWGAMINTKIK